MKSWAGFKTPPGPSALLTNQPHSATDLHACDQSDDVPHLQFLVHEVQLGHAPSEGRRDTVQRAAAGGQGALPVENNARVVCRVRSSQLQGSCDG